MRPAAARQVHPLPPAAHAPAARTARPHLSYRGHAGDRGASAAGGLGLHYCCLAAHTGADKKQAFRLVAARGKVRSCKKRATAGRFFVTFCLSEQRQRSANYAGSAAISAVTGAGSHTDWSQRHTKLTSTTSEKAGTMFFEKPTNVMLEITGGLPVRPALPVLRAGRSARGVGVMIVTLSGWRPASRPGCHAPCLPRPRTESQLTPPHCVHRVTEHRCVQRARAAVLQLAVLPPSPASQG